MKKTILLGIIFLGLSCFNVLETKADSLCGPAGFFDSTQPKTYESYATNFSGKLCVNAEPSPLPKFPDKGGRVEWTCYDASRQNPQLCYAKRNSNIQQHSCTGDNCVTDDKLSAGEIDLICQNGTITATGWVQDPAEPGIAYDFTESFVVIDKATGKTKHENICYGSTQLYDCKFEAENSGINTVEIYVQKTHGGMEKTKIATKDVFCGDPNNHSFLKIDPNPISGDCNENRVPIKFSWKADAFGADNSSVQIRYGSADGKILTSSGSEGTYTSERLVASRIYLIESKTGKVLAFDTARTDDGGCSPDNAGGVCFGYKKIADEKESVLKNVSICPFDRLGFGGASGSTLVPECTPNEKCEFICNEGYEFKQNDSVWYCAPSDTPPTPIVDPNPNDLCGPAGSSDPNSPVEYLANDIRFRGDTCVTGEPIPYDITFPFESGMTVEWTCKDESGAKSEKCYAHRSNGFFSCSGTVPEGAVKCYLDGDGLAVPSEWTSVGNSSTNCTTQKKCEYYFPQFVPGSECGTANKKIYEATDKSFGDDTLCAKGYLTPKETNFPGEGKTIDWKCTEKTNPSFWDSILSRGIVSCSAGRKSSWSDNGCGTASGSYLQTENAFRSENFCQTGYGFLPLSTKPTFPTENGTSVEWECEYGFFDRLFRGKKNIICSAKKGTTTNNQSLVPCFGNIPTNAIKCLGDENGAITLQAWKIAGNSSKSCTEEGKCEYYVPQTIENQSGLKNKTHATGLLPDTGVDICLPKSKGCVGQIGTYPAKHLMSFTKLDKEGKELAKTDTTSKWATLRDNVTGLVWEVKTNDNSLHDGDNKYTFSEAEEYIKKLNQANFNGRNDWRLPAAKEFFNLRDFSGDYKKRKEIEDNLHCYMYNQKPSLSFYGRTFWTTNKTSDGNSLVARINDDSFNYDSFNNYNNSQNTVQHHVIAVSGKNIEGNYSDNNDGTITNNSNGLMWLKTSLPRNYFWRAIDVCEKLDFAGHSDWRMPNIKELISRIDIDKADMFLSSNIYPGDQLTAYVGGFSNKYGAFVGRGNFSLSYYVRCVRGGK